MLEFLERLRPPRAGWLSLGLLAVMAVALAWSVQGAGWLDQLDYLAPVALWAVVFGALLGVLPMSIVVLLPLGAAIGAGIVVWTVGGEYHTALDQLGRLLALRTDLVHWIVVVLRTGYPNEMSPYAIGLGALMWSTAFIGSYVIYRYHRVLDAILLMGAALIVNMSATFTDLFGHLLLFVTAAILLWLRGALVDRQDGWQRRRVNEDLDVPASIMRSGILVAGASVALAWILTGVAVAAPLTGAWQAFDDVWTDARDHFEGVFGSLTNPDSRITGSSFGPSFAVTGSWVSRDAEVLRVAASRPVYLRTVTYDEYTGRGWRRSDGPERLVPAGEPLFTGPPERPTIAAGVVVERITVEMLQTIGRNLFTAGSPLTVYAPAVVHETGGYPVLGGIESEHALSENEAYQLNVALSTATEAQLGAAGTDYPDGVTQLYLSTPGLTDGVHQLALDVTANARNPYEQAKALADFLSRHASFTYETTAAVAPTGRDMVDFFLFDPEANRTGYCQYYASAMVLMARSLGLPARVAVGFAPGERQDDGTYLVREANAHAWAEIYFPGYGWQIFEATKSIRSGFVRLSGDPANALPPQIPPGLDPLVGEEAALDALGDGGPLASPDLDGAVDPLGPGGIDDGAATRTGNAVLIALLALGAGLVVWLRMRHLQRRWRLLPAGDRAWRHLTAAAGRAGVGPRPSETIYEYAGWLEDQLPRHVVPIQTVASGKVWQS
ncbi:MAG TPA: transglutaminaseTgpA domain-containing protein, partial [Methylomirabilota bacterium]|nr:transglutaminaseTgpA domain-containing protein [Methylomirabilota bacterium]